MNTFPYRKSPTLASGDSKMPGSYREAVDHQLEEWVAGRPWHNPYDHDNTLHPGDTTHGECCPDFSCCQPSLLWPEAKRQEFAQAEQEGRERMMMGALTGALEHAGHKVITSEDVT